jgi:hypothetical protein
VRRKDSVVGIGTRLLAGQLRNHLIAGKDKRFFSIPKHPRLILEPVKHPIQWVMVTTCLHLVLRLRMNASKPPFPFLPIWYAQEQLYFSNTNMKYVACIGVYTCL